VARRTHRLLSLLAIAQLVCPSPAPAQIDWRQGRHPAGSLAPAVIPQGVAPPALPERPPIPVPAPIATPPARTRPATGKPISWRSAPPAAEPTAGRPAEQAPASAHQESRADERQAVAQVKTYAAGFEETLAAVVSACRTVGLVVDKLDSDAGVVAARAADGALSPEQAIFSLEEQAPGRTTVKLRVQSAAGVRPAPGITASGQEPVDVDAHRLLRAVESFIGQKRSL